MSARIEIAPTTMQSVKGALLSSFAVVPFGTAANIAMDRATHSTVLGFLACLVTVMILQTMIRTPITQRVIRRDLRREASASDRIRRMEEVRESERMRQPWHAAAIASETVGVGRAWLDEVRSKAIRLEKCGRTSSNQAVIEALVDHDKNLPALTAEYARARLSSGESARRDLDRDFLDAIELYEGVVDKALAIVETEARAGFDTRVRHLRGRSGDPLLGPIEDPRP